MVFLSIDGFADKLFKAFLRVPILFVLASFKGSYSFVMASLRVPILFLRAFSRVPILF